jgi:IS1 family transposase
MQALFEGMGINATSRLTGFSKMTILKLLADLGTACQKFHDEKVRGLFCQRIQVDEVWAFCHAKQKNLPADLHGRLGFGDVWTFTGIDADTKLMVTWLAGRRSAEFACDFMLDLEDRVINRIQLTTDGMNKYMKAVEDAFGTDIDYAQLIKIYGPDRSTPIRYSPPKLTGVNLEVRCGDPDMNHVSTSYVERANLTMRMQMRRYTRLTNGHSKKFQNHVHMNAAFFTYYNFCRVHMTLKTTPAVAAGLVDERWTLEDLIGLID